MMNHLVAPVSLMLFLSLGLASCGGGGGSDSSGAGGAGGAGGGGAGAPVTDTEDSGPPLTVGEMSNAGGSTLTDGDPVDEAPPSVTPPEDTAAPDTQTPDSQTPDPQTPAEPESETTGDTPLPPVTESDELPTASETPTGPAVLPEVTTPQDDAPTNPPTGLASIAGLWDDSYTFPNGTVNITYLQITADGRYVNYDYRGDSFDLGQNCYETIAGVITEEDGGGYRSVVLGEELRFDAIAEGGQLRVTFEGGAMTTLAEVTGVSTTDFNACQ